MSFWISFGLFLAVFVFLYLNTKFRYKKSKKQAPSIEPQPLLGNLWNLGVLSGKTTFTQTFYDLQRTLGDSFIFWFGSWPILTFCTKDAAQQIFSDRQTFDQSPLFLPNFDILCPHALFMPTGPKWKRHIRVMLPMFKRAKIRHHTEKILNAVDRWIENNFHQDQIHGDFLKKAQSLTMNVIGWIAFDYDLDTSVDRQLKKAFEDFSFYSTSLFVIPWVPRWMLRFFFKINWKYQNCRRMIHSLIEKIMEKEIQNHQTDEKQRPQNLIALMISSLNENANDAEITSGLRSEEIYDEILVSILAGYDTTSTALTWLIFYLSKYPQVQKRIRDELDEHGLLSNVSDDELTEEKLDRLVYCEAVVKETLRHSPVASITSRIALKDAVIEGVPIERGQNIFISLTCINHDKRHWHYADPNEFVPERFLADDKYHEAFTFVPFGGGHRACIGQELAWFELKLILIRMFQRNIVIEDTPQNTGGFEEVLTCFPKNMAVRIIQKKTL